MCAAGMVNLDRLLRWDVFGYLLSNKHILQLAVVKPPSSLEGEDESFWGFSRNGNFTTKLAY